MRLLPLLAAFAASLTLPAATAAQPGENEVAQRVRGHVEFLADDLLEGRQAGTRGHEVAAAYVAAEFRKLGLEPAGEDGSWFQQVPFRTATHAGDPSLLFLPADGSAPVALKPGEDFGLRPSLTMARRSVEAPLLFVGHGIRAPHLGVDDYAGLDARGKIVIALEGAPDDLPSDVSAHLQSAKDEIAAQQGAVGFVELSQGKARPGRQTGLERRLRPLTGWVTADGRSSAGPLAVDLALSDSWGKRLFADAPQKLGSIFAAGRRGSVRGFALSGRLRVEANSDWSEFKSPNVVARMPGSDPALKDRNVVLMAHLDHLGNHGDSASADAVRNGALDNAAGVATMIEAARRFAQSGSAPKRSILFVATTAEEMGLLGASYFAEAAEGRAGRIDGLVNLDMPLLLYDFTDVIAFGAEHSTLARDVAVAASSMGVSVGPDPMPEQTLFVRSDHYPLVKKGVPSIFLMTGHANGGKKAWDHFLGSTYHRSNDDLTQPIDWRAGARFAELNYRIARAIADSPAPPLWYRDSYFGRVFAPDAPKADR